MILPRTGVVAGRVGSTAFAHNSFAKQSKRHISHSVQSSNSLLRQSHPRQPLITNQYLHQQVVTQSRMATSLASSSIPEILTSVGPVKAIGSFVGVFSLLAILKYSNAIKRRYRQVREESWIFGAGVKMERIDTPPGSTKKPTTGVFQNLRLMEINPEFQAKCEKEGHKVISLGDYMAQLRPKGLPKKLSVEDTPKLIQREIEAGLAAGLLKILGPNLGRALLPAVGSGLIQRKAQGLAGSIATKWVMSDEGAISESKDKGGIPVALMTLLAISDTNAKVNSGKSNPVKDSGVANMELNAMDKMKVGEIIKGPPFVQNPDDTFLVPNDFVVSKHFHAAVAGMEEILAGHDERGDMTSTELKMAQDAAIEKEGEHKDAKDYKAKNIEHEYDPEDRRVGEPVPVNPRLFPGLHLGFGDALNSHTKREVVKMRLLSILLNKLGANYYSRANGEPKSSLFQLRMNEGDKPITTPWEFVQAIQDAGHNVQIVPTSRMTTFGLALCVKEKDDTWSNIPLGVFLETGYEDKDGNMAPAMMPHSGVDMLITGPLAGNRADGTPSELQIQHFVGVEGFCGWHPHSNPQVPFNEAIERGPHLTGDDAVRAARLCGLYANVLNGLATEMELPFGGYGLTAVCNDSAAVVQQCLYGVNTIYPMTSIGRFMLKTMRYAEKFQNQLRQSGSGDGDNDTTLQEELQALSDISHAMKKVPSDLNASPSGAHSAATRLLATLQPSMPLRLMKDSKKVMESILQEESMSEVEEAGQARAHKVNKVENKKEKVYG